MAARYHRHGWAGRRVAPVRQRRRPDEPDRDGVGAARCDGWLDGTSACCRSRLDWARSSSRSSFSIWGLLPLVDRSRLAAVVKIAAVVVAVVGVHAGYSLLRPADWNEYVQAVMNRTMVEKDFGWGPSALIMRFNASNGAAFAGYLAGLLIVIGLSYHGVRRSARAAQTVSPTAIVSLAFVVLTFANPRVPLYDLFAAGIALAICCGLTGHAAGMPWVLLLAMTVNFVPWLIANFAAAPAAYPWWVRDLLVTHLFGIGSLLIALARTGIGWVDVDPDRNRANTAACPSQRRGKRPSAGCQRTPGRRRPAAPAVPSRRSGRPSASRSSA